MRVVLLFTCFLIVHWVGAAEIASLRLATFNVNCRNQHHEQVLEALRATKADLVFLQETTIQLEQFLRDELHAYYPHFYATGYHGRYAEERLAFVSKIPLRQVEYSPPERGLFGFYSAVYRLGQTSVKVINVHLTPFVIRRGLGIGGVLAEIEGTEHKHAAEMEAIVGTFDVREPVVVAGDFNSLSTFAAPSRLVKMGLIDSYAARHAAPDAQPTWQGTVDSMVLRLRLDYIFHTPRFRTVESQIVTQGGSDHFLVVSELSLLEQVGGANGSQPIRSETNSTSSTAGSRRSP